MPIVVALRLAVRRGRPVTEAAFAVCDMYERSAGCPRGVAEDRIDRYRSPRTFRYHGEMMRLGTMGALLCLAACWPDDPPESRELGWQVAVGFPEAKWMFPSSDGRVCAANDAKYTLDGSRISGGYVFCAEGAATWQVKVADDGNEIAALPSIGRHWAFRRGTEYFQMQPSGVTPLTPPVLGWRAYTGTGKQLSQASGQWELVTSDGMRAPLESPSLGGTLAAVGVNDDVILGDAATGYFVVSGGTRQPVLAPTADAPELIGQADDGTVFAATMAPTGAITYWRAKGGAITKIDQPPYTIDNRHHAQCGVNARGALLCLMYFAEAFDEQTGEGWLGHYELVRLDGSSWQRLGLGPPGSASEQYAFVVAVDDHGYVFVKDTAQFGVAYGLRY